MPTDSSPALAAIGCPIFHNVGDSAALLATSPKARNRPFALIPCSRVLRDVVDRPLRNHGVTLLVATGALATK